jgi:hypothetical protein
VFNPKAVKDWEIHGKQRSSNPRFLEYAMSVTADFNPLTIAGQLRFLHTVQAFTIKRPIACSVTLFVQGTSGSQSNTR